MLQMKAIVAGDQALKQVQAVQKAWRVAMTKEGRAIKTEYDKTHSTWETAVQFQISRKDTPSELATIVSTGNRIYWFVHEGIAVMHAKLSPDWVPKTKQRVLGSGPGAGRVLFVSKKYEGPKYKPREFTEKIIEERQSEFQKAMEKATQDGVKKGP